MKKTAAVFVFLFCGSVAADDASNAKAYLREVNKHLLESYIHRDKMDEDRVVNAALDALVRAMDHKDFADLEEEVREAVRSAIP